MAADMFQPTSNVPNSESHGVDSQGSDPRASKVDRIIDQMLDRMLEQGDGANGKRAIESSGEVQVEVARLRDLEQKCGAFIQRQAQQIDALGESLDNLSARVGELEARLSLETLTRPDATISDASTEGVGA